MGFQFSEASLDLRERLTAFMDRHVYPNENVYWEQIDAAEDRWASPPIIEELKARAKGEGLWNLFLPDSHYGAGLTNLDYAPLAEIMGRVYWASEVFNCSAPDTGNMETIERYGTPEQKKQWLEPLLAGEIRSAFSMTEPEVASSRCNQHPHHDSPRRRRIRHQWPQMVQLRRQRACLQDTDRDGQDRSGSSRPPQAAIHDPGAEGYARREDRQEPAGVRVGRSAPRSCRNRL